MGLKFMAARLVGKLTKKGLRMAGRDGSSLPGMVASKIDNDILSKLAKDYRVVVVTGTNGKTLTTALIAAVFKTRWKNILTNPSGANMIQGIVSCFVTDCSKKSPKIAILEVDEASLQHITAKLQVEVLVFTNVFRDQMDRYGEIYSTWKLMIDGARNVPNATILANGDMPLFHNISLDNPVFYYGFSHLPDEDFAAAYNADGIICPQCEQLLRYRFITYSNLGKYYCPNCNFSRPELTYSVNKIVDLTTSSSTFKIDNTTFTIPIAGCYNIYNALAAYSVARQFGFSTDEICQAMHAAKGVFGRQESLWIGDKKLTLNLIKNPVGFNQIVDLLSLEQTSFGLVVLLNDRPADGTDVSWIWDGDFEKLVSLTTGRPILLSGIRTNDLAVRFRVAGVPNEELYIESHLEQLSDRIQKMPQTKIYILATYTALLDLRRVFSQQGYMEGGMEK